MPFITQSYSVGRAESRFEAGTQPIFVIGPEGEAQIANTRIYRNIVIVDRPFGTAELRLGSGKQQQTVRIVRADEHRP